MEQAKSKRCIYLLNKLPKKIKCEINEAGIVLKLYESSIKNICLISKI